MRWFKHYTGASQSGDLVRLEAEFGLPGYARWWKLLEAVGATTEKGKSFSIALPWHRWEALLSGRRKQLAEFLVALENLGLCNLVATGQQTASNRVATDLLARCQQVANAELLICEVPKMAQHRDNHSRNLQATGKRLASIEEEIEEEVEESEFTPEGEQNPGPPAEAHPQQAADPPLAPQEEATEEPPPPEPEAYPLEVHQLCARLAHAIVSNGGKRPTVGKRWLSEMDRLLRLDKREPEDVEAVIDWCQADDFWRSNILSPGNLRKHYDRLLMQRERGHRSGQPVQGARRAPRQERNSYRSEGEQLTAETW